MENINKTYDVMYEFSHTNQSLGNPNECLGITLLNTISRNTVAINDVNIVHYSHMFCTMRYNSITVKHIKFPCWNL